MTIAATAQQRTAAVHPVHHAGTSASHAAAVSDMSIGTVAGRGTLIRLSDRRITAGLPSIVPMAFGTPDPRALSSFRLHVEPASSRDDDAEGVSRMQKRYQSELRRRHAISERNIDAAKALYVAYHRMMEQMQADPASVTRQDIDRVMTLAEEFFEVDWRRDTRAAGHAYQCVSHPSSLLALIPSAYYALSNDNPVSKAKLALVAQVIYSVFSFVPPTISHSIVFHWQSRSMLQAAKTTSDSVKTPTLKAAIDELTEATEQFERVAELMHGEERDNTSIRLLTDPDHARRDTAFHDAYRRLLAARGECAKVESKFAIEQAALYNTTIVRGLRVVVGLAAALISFLTANPKYGLYALALGAVGTMIAQAFAGLPDTANKAAAQLRTTPRAVDILDKAGITQRSPVTADDISREDLDQFIKTLAQESLAGPIEIRVGAVKKRLEYEKRLVAQQIATIHGARDCDSFIRLAYLARRADELTLDEERERDTLARQYAQPLSGARQRDYEACLSKVVALERDIAVLEEPDWSALSSEGKSVLMREMEAYDKPGILPAAALILKEGLSDLAKPEQVCPLAINKCVQAFTMILGGSSTPQLISAVMRLVTQLVADQRNAPDYQLPRWTVLFLILGSMLALYGSRMGPPAATHTVQLRSDLKKRLEEGTLNIPAGWRMYSSAAYWKLFFGELPGSVVAQRNINRKLSVLGAVYKRSEALIQQSRAPIQATRHPREHNDLEAGVPDYAHLKMQAGVASRQAGLISQRKEDLMRETMETARILRMLEERIANIRNASSPAAQSFHSF